MYYSRIRFGSVTSKDDGREEAEEKAYSYIGSLTQGGQIVGDVVGGWSSQGFEVYTYLQGYAALAIRNHTKWGIEHRNNAIEYFGREPECEILDPEVPKSLPRWRKSPYLFLFMEAWSCEPPIRAAKEHVPTYLLPLSAETKMDIYFWQQSYKSHDEIWLGSGDLEIPAYKQLVEPTSELNKSGRELCQEIEKTTGISTYYYLMRYWGDSRYEADRVCPGCGGKWRVKGVKSDPDRKDPFCQFQFRCETCRLLSHEASSMDDDRRRAKIGLWRIQI